MAESAEGKAMPEAEKKKEQSLPYHQLFSFADKYDYLLMFSGSIGAIVHGSTMPIFFLLFGEMINGFGKNQTDLHKMTHEVCKVLQYFDCIQTFCFMLCARSQMSILDLILFFQMRSMLYTSSTLD